MDRSIRLKNEKDVNWKELTEVLEQTFPGFQCNICKKFFPSKPVLERHHGIHSNGKSLVCSGCGKLQPLIEYKTKLSKEILLMGGKCSKGESNFTRKSSQRERLKYICDVRKQRFAFGTVFEMHARKHSGIKNVYCSRCSECENTINV
ncbi:hypothetical protein NPIL_440381 [Nephila pilipes]|uniref:C2H2-type domain-containing protein n=1 Tax=Nephila pilipes TaxID=299642 RepID=A0A8X6TID6_NEPPI|nr:hypothetical protein NPIL_440381 [Nephila pilipes]